MIGRDARAPDDDLDAEGIDALAEALVAGTVPIELCWIRDDYEEELSNWHGWRDASVREDCDGCAHAVATRLWPRLQAERRAQAEEDAAQAAEDRWE